MQKEFEEDALPEQAPPVGTAPGVLPAEPPEGAIHRLEEQLREAQERHLRLAAEFDNFRKRVARERIERGAMTRQFGRALALVQPNPV